MSHARILRMGIWVLTAGCIALCIIGCGPSKEVQALQEQNVQLTDQIADLEGQLEQAGLEYYAVTMGQQTSSGGGSYLVIAGDTLWSIAQKQLGSGNRYKEILAMNPQLSQDKPLKIGTTLKMPPK